MENNNKDCTTCASGWFWQTDANLAYTHVSQSYEKITGRKVSTMIGQSSRDLYKGLFPREKQNWQQHLHELENRENCPEFTFTTFQENGKYMSIRKKTRAILNENGVFQGYRGTSKDVSEVVAKDRVAAMVHEALATYPDGIMLADLNEQIIFTNNRYHEIYPALPDRREICKYSTEEILRFMTQAGMNTHPLARLDPEAWIAMRLAQFHGADAGEGETSHASGSTYQYRFQRTQDGGMIHMLADITERKQAAEEIKENRDELEKLNRQKDSFFNIIAHDLKTPFTSLLGISQLLSAKAEDLSRARVVEYSNLLHQSADGAFKLLEDLLDWSRLQLDRLEFEPQTFDVSALLQDNIERQRVFANTKNIEILNTARQAFTIYADVAMVATIFRNLLNNAIKFTPNGGQILVNVQDYRGTIEVSFKDNGEGVPAQWLDKVFVLGEKTSKKGTNGESGTGLGLPLCLALAKKQGGDILVENVKPQGVIFRVLLPAGQCSK